MFNEFPSWVINLILLKLFKKNIKLFELNNKSIDTNKFMKNIEELSLYLKSFIFLV